MKPISKFSLRAAADIHRSLQASHQQHAHITLPCETWDLLQQYVRQTKLARKRNWHAAARRFQERIADMLQCLQNLVAEELRMIASDAQSRPIQSQQAIYDDIQALREEFDEVEVDLGGHSLSVTTEPIALEGVSLGRFQIQLDWVELLEDHCYEVIALDPNPSAKSDGITHPHVESGHLCEGEAYVPIQRALKEGRILDFFSIVAQVLRTYNSASPYVPLDDWGGVGCTECGFTMDEENSWSCEKCGSTLCNECSFNCEECDRIICSGCRDECHGCKNTLCSTCAYECDDCSHVFCEECLDDERCQNCRESAQQEGDVSEKPEGNNADQPGAPVHSHGVGQAAVSA